MVEIEIRLPACMPDAERQQLLDAEARRAAELRDAGTIARLWRVPGRFANIGLWEAPDATFLHEAVASLPLFRWMDVRVTALARHPSEENAVR